MYKVLKRTCWAIVLPTRSFVFPCPRCRRHRGLPKVPIVIFADHLYIVFLSLLINIACLWSRMFQFLVYPHYALGIADPRSMRDECHIWTWKWLTPQWCLCYFVVEHRSAVSEGRRFSCSWGLRLVFVSSSWPEERTILFVLFRTRNSSSVLFCFIVFLSVSWAYLSPVLISLFLYRDCQTIAGLPGPIHEGLSILKKVKIFPAQFNLSFY